MEKQGFRDKIHFSLCIKTADRRMTLISLSWEPKLKTTEQLKESKNVLGLDDMSAQVRAFDAESYRR